MALLLKEDGRNDEDERNSRSQRENTCQNSLSIYINYLVFVNSCGGAFHRSASYLANVVRKEKK